MKKLFLFFLLFTPYLLIAQEDGYDIIKKMIEKSSEINRVEFSIFMSERIDGKMLQNRANAKINRKPVKIYYKQKPPDEAEILYVEGENDNDALVYPCSFPYINIDLDPYGSTIRDGRHHTLFELDFAYSVSIIENMLNKYKTDIKKYITYKGTVTFDGQKCHHIILDNTDFKYTTYTVKNGETISSISKKYWLNDFLILEKNPDYDHYKDVDAGDKLKIPVTYGKKVEMYIDAERSIPLMLKIYDEKGLFEHFEFTNIKLNPYFDSNTFSRNNDKYGF